MCRSSPAHDAASRAGTALKLQGLGPEARAAFTRAVQLRPSDSAAHGDLAACLYDEGDMRGAVEEYRAALAAPGGQNSPDVCNNLGERLGREADYNGAGILD
jgi:Flp pilus assembly protein TadD